LTRFCSARLQAGTLKSSRCPPEGGRYINQNRVLKQDLNGRTNQQGRTRTCLLFLLSLCIRLLTSGMLSPAPNGDQNYQEENMSIAQSFLPEFDHEMQSTRKLLECVPDGKFSYKPHEKSMTLGHLASHVAQIPEYVISTIRLERLDFTGSEKPFEATTRKELLDAFDAKSAEARNALSGASDEEMAKIWTLTYKGQQIFSLPRAAVLRSMCLNHLYHHRGQLGVYLRLNNVAIPGMYGPSADEMNMFNAQSA
jgi:uncharacterized damage-inducible protein DinB